MNNPTAAEILGMCDRNTALIQKVFDELAVYHHLPTAKERETCIGIAADTLNEYEGGTVPVLYAARLWSMVAWNKLLLVFVDDLQFYEVEGEVTDALSTAIDKLLDLRKQLTTRRE